MIAIAATVACGHTDEAAEADDGTLRGELAVYVADDFQGVSETLYALRMSDGEERRLSFDGEVGLPPGARIAVSGVPSGDAIHVTSFRALPAPLATRNGALVSGTAYPARSFALVLVDIGGGISVTVDGMKGTLIDDPDSLRNYYLDDSFARQDITAEVLGPFSNPLTSCTSTDMGRLASALRPRLPMGYDHYLWFLGSTLRACNWAGLASLGTPDAPTRDTWYNNQTSCTVLVQEPGHNFGMQHSSSLRCPGASLADNPNNCTASEYGDIFDPMGNACRHMNAWQKAYQGWFGGCNGVAVTDSGTFTLLPIEGRCDGAQFLKVKAAKPRTFNRPAAGGGGATVETLAYYYVELRSPQGFDGLLGNRSMLNPQILIHAGNDIRSRAQTGLHTFLLDMTPNTTGSSGFGDAALAVGSTFTDPAGGVSITAQAVSATQATIKVDVTNGTGAPTCLDGTTFVGPGPGPESCAVGGGAGGAAGTGGSIGSGGRGGAGGAGTTGSAGENGGGRGGGGDRGAAGGAEEDAGAEEAGTTPMTPVENGCNCGFDPRAPRGRGGAIAALVLVALAVARRRRGRVALALAITAALAGPALAQPPEAAGNAAASATTGVGALETPATATGARPRWHGSVLLIDQSMTTQTAGIGADYQSANPTYEWWIAFKPQVFLFERAKDRLSINLWTNLYLELTNSDTTTEKRELLLGPTYLWSSYARTLAERGGYKTTVTAGPRLTLPTDEAARAAGQYFVLGAGLGGAQAFPLRSKDARVLRGLRLGASAIYNHPFWAATTPINDDIHQLRQDLGGRTIIDDQLRGPLNAKHALNLYFTGDLQILSRLAFAASYVLLQQWSYEPTPAVVPTMTGPVVVGPGIADPTTYRVTTWLTSSFDYALTNELLVSLGYLNRALQLAPDGTRRNPFWSPEARLFLTVTCRLDAFYARVTHRPLASD
jgi:hypothetical protein